MVRHIVSTFLVAGAIATAQTFPRRAILLGGGDSSGGQCTAEFVVDGAAEIEIRGGNAILRNLNGQAPQWRRFECSSVMPSNPTDFSFAGIDGRGRQQLVSDPRNGGAAVVRIEDPDSGAERYTFTVTWNGAPFTQDRRSYGAPQGRVFPGGPPPQEDEFHRGRDAAFQGNNAQSRFFERIREDLDHVSSNAVLFNGDQTRIARTQMELDELQDKLSQGFYDQQELDEAIAALRVVLQANRLAPSDRAMLGDDIRRMQDFRVRHDQYGARDVEGVYHRERDQRFSGNDWRATFFQHIREDLDHVESNTFPFGSDSARLARTKFELDELQQKLAQGTYDEQELDEAMGALQVVVSSNRLGVRDRQVLTDDLTRMRDFRIRHDQFGAR